MPFTPVYLRNAWVRLKVTSGGTFKQYSCQVKRFALMPEPGEEVTVRTLCDDGSYTEIGATTWTLEMDGLQGWGTTDGLSRFLFDNRGAAATFEVDQYGEAHTPTAEEPGFTGSCRLVPGPYGGEVDTYAEFEVVLPVSGEPVLVVAAWPVATGLEGEPEPEAA